MTHTQKDLRLLPNSYKKVALAILGISILVAVLAVANLLPMDKEILKIHAQTGILISLLLFALSKNKIEDERTLRIRLTAFTSAFLFGIIMTIIDPYISLVMGGEIFSDKGTFQLISSMLFMYFIVFYIAKSQN